MVAPLIGQPMVCLADKTYTTANCMHVLPLLSLMGFIAVVKSGGQFSANNCAWYIYPYRAVTQNVCHTKCVNSLLELVVLVCLQPLCLQSLYLL